MKTPLLLSCTLLGLAAAPSLQAAGLTATGRTEGDAFGRSTGLSGTTALVGENNKNNFQGAAYIYWTVTTGSSTARTQNLKLLASDGTGYSNFGYSSSLSGATALVGATGFNFQTGAAYVFRDVTTGSGGTRTENLKLIASDGATRDQFGSSVSLSGTTALVGAQYAAVGSNATQGAAYVYRDVSTGSGTRTEDLKLIASDGRVSNFFGSAVSLSGSIALVGANRSGFNPDFSGSAYVFRDVTTGSGGTRTEDLKLTASDAAGGDFFGQSVIQSGTIALIGANGKNSNQGAAYVFRDVSTGSGGVTEDLKLIASDGGADDQFGYSISLSGTTALAGAVGKSSFTGAVYLYRDVTSGSGTRTQDIKLTASDAVSNAYFGNSVSLDGDNFIIGSSGKDSFRGKAYTGSVSSMTTLDAGNTSRTISGLTFISQGDWIIGQTTDGNTVQLSSGDTANVTASGKAVYIGQNAGSDNNTLIVSGVLTATTVYLGSAAGNTGNTLQIGTGGTTGSVAGDIVNYGNLAFNRSDSSQHGNQVSGSGTVTKLGSGTIALTAGNTYTGGTVVNAGTLTAGSAAAFGSGTVRVNAGTLNLGGFAVSNALDVRGGTLTGLANYTGTQTLSAAMNYSGTVGGSLIVAGGGTLRTTGAVFTGATTVQSGGQVSGTGSLGSLTLLAGSILSPGNSPGILTVTGNATWNGGASYNWQIQDATSAAGTGYDLLSISGSLTLAATTENTFTLTLASLLANNTAGDALNFNSAVNSSYTIASATGGIFGFNADAFTINASGFTNNVNGGSWNLTQVGNNINLNFAAAAAIPEPSTYAAILGTLVLTLAARRRHRARSPGY